MQRPDAVARHSRYWKLTVPKHRDGAMFRVRDTTVLGCVSPSGLIEPLVASADGTPASAETHADAAMGVASTVRAATLMEIRTQHWWRCPWRQRTLGRIVDGRVVVKVEDRRITLSSFLGSIRRARSAGWSATWGGGLMATYRGKTFKDRVIKLDGNEYHDCTFERCKLRYAAAGKGVLSNNAIRECQWEFVGAALETIAFMTSLFHGLGPAGALVVEDLFTDIRTGRLLPKDPDPPKHHA